MSCNKSHKALATTIQRLGRLLNEDEIFNFYCDHVKRNACRYDLRTGKYDEYEYQEVKQLATAFYYRQLGRMVHKGEIVVSI